MRPALWLWVSAARHLGFSGAAEGSEKPVDASFASKSPQLIFDRHEPIQKGRGELLAFDRSERLAAFLMRLLAARRSLYKCTLMHVLDRFTITEILSIKCQCDILATGDGGIFDDNSAMMARLLGYDQGSTPMDTGQSLIAELEEAIQSGLKHKRVDTPRRITDLFLEEAERLTTVQIEVFDDILRHLITRVEGKALTELSRHMNESTLLEFARRKKFAELAAGISHLCSAPVELIADLLQSEHREAFLIPCKAAGLEWPTVCLVLSSGSLGRVIADQDMDRARADYYYRLTRNSAQRVPRFWQVRQKASSTHIPNAPRSAVATGR